MESAYSVFYHCIFFGFAPETWPRANQDSPVSNAHTKKDFIFATKDSDRSFAEARAQRPVD